MGYIRHHAIIVTSWKPDLLQGAHAHACKLFNADQVGSIAKSPWNSYQTFTVAPDGSKEGWPQSHAGDAERNAFIEWINSRRYDDGSTSIDWVEVQYGDEDGDDRVIQSNRLLHGNRITAPSNDLTSEIKETK